MGDIKKVLYCEDIGRREVESAGIWFDLCENCHLHFKNYRFDFSVREWSNYYYSVHTLYNASKQAASMRGWREGGDPGNVVAFALKNIYKFSDYYPHRLLIEWQRDNTFHVHYRELRLRLSEKEFEALTDALIEARNQKDNHVEVKLKSGRQKVHINKIQPYDEGHRAGDLDEDHARGIRYCKHLIEQGKKMRPILVRPDGQRLDGFKRYMAQKEMGFKEIEVIVDPKGKMGGQKGQSLECDP